jgi:hypothetical protein
VSQRVIKPQNENKTENRSVATMLRMLRSYLINWLGLLGSYRSLGLTLDIPSKV